ILEEGLAVARRAEDPESIAHALYRLSDLNWWSGDYATAQSMGEAALASSRAAGHGALEASCLFSLGAAAWGQGQFAEARARLEECYSLSQQVGFPRGVAMALALLGRVSLAQGDLDLASAQLTSSQDVFGTFDFPWGTAFVLVPLGWVALQRRDVAKARTLLVQSVRLYEQLGERVWVLRSLEGLAAVAVAEGRYEQAARQAGAVSALRARASVLASPVEQIQLEHWLNSARARIGEEQAESAEAAGRLFHLEQAIAEAVVGPPKAARPG
ncbi:MAG TPA: tetratricopeptide repeat protein, partial [Ktedonobacterales bacterium]|nr:tetratricopeptide repeat protein [Ktedonobacterales bacterium]